MCLHEGKKGKRAKTEKGKKAKRQKGKKNMNIGARECWLRDRTSQPAGGKPTLTAAQSSGRSSAWSCMLAASLLPSPMYCSFPSLSYTAYTPDAAGNAAREPSSARVGIEGVSLKGGRALQVGNPRRARACGRGCEVFDEMKRG